MDSFYSNIRKLPGTLAYLLVSLILMYVAWEVISHIFNWEGVAGQIRRFIPSNLSAYWPVLVTALLFSGIFLSKPFNLVAWLILLITVMIFFFPFLNWVGSSLDRGVNHGDWSEPSDYIKNVRGGTVNIGQEGFDRFLATGTFKLKNTYSGQCMHPRPETPHTYAPLDNGYVVYDLYGQVIYTMTWSNDGWTYTIRLTDGRSEMITVTTTPLGATGCAPNRI